MNCSSSSQKGDESILCASQVRTLFPQTRKWVVPLRFVLVSFRNGLYARLYTPDLRDAGTVQMAELRAAASFWSKDKNGILQRMTCEDIDDYFRLKPDDPLLFRSKDKEFSGVSLDVMDRRLRNIEAVRFRSSNDRYVSPWGALDRTGAKPYAHMPWVSPVRGLLQTACRNAGRASVLADLLP